VNCYLCSQLEDGWHPFDSRRCETPGQVRCVDVEACDLRVEILDLRACVKAADALAEWTFGDCYEEPRRAAYFDYVKARAKIGVV